MAKVDGTIVIKLDEEEIALLKEVRELVKIFTSDNKQITPKEKNNDTRLQKKASGNTGLSVDRK